MSRLQIENIIGRARELNRLEADRLTTRAALLDITLDVAETVARNTHQLVEQNVLGSKESSRLVRKMQREWRAIIKGVRAVFSDFPITDRHLYAVVITYYKDMVNLGDFNQDLTGDEYFQLQRCTSKAERRYLLRQILNRF